MTKRRITHETTGLRVYFNPFAFTDEDNQEFLRCGYEIIPIAVPKGDT